MPINDDDIEKHMKENDDVKEAITAAVDDFLKLELKMTEEEIKDFKIIDITRLKKEDAQRVYLHCETEEGPQYIIRKNIQIQNDEVRIVPFVPPQIYRRFSELSRLTFLARKENSNLKTQIRIGDSDLILLVRDKEEKEWTVTNLFR